MSENQTPGEESQLEELAMRLLIYPGDPRAKRPRLFLGKIPENFPLDLPVPEGARVLGTLARSEENVEIVLESDLTPDEVITFYRERLQPLGWNEPENDMQVHMGGFVHGGIGRHNHLTLCQGPDGPSLMLSILQLEGKGTDMRLHFNLGREGNPCKQQRRPRHRMHHSHQEMIPPLMPPTGAQQHGGGGGGSDIEWHSNATLKTNLTLDALARHYAEQLRQGGWTLSGEGASGPLAWHTWKFTNEEQESWNGLFFILKKPEREEEYILNVRIEWDNPEGNSPFTGWMGSASMYSTGSTILKKPSK